MHCPSCGSVVDETATTCPVCGEDLAPTTDTPPAERPASERAADERVAAIPAAAAGEPEPAASPTKLACPECGAANPLGATECSTCGASLEGAAAMRATRTSATAAPAAENKGMLQTYIIAGLAMAVIALVIYIVSTPEEKTGPPQAAAPAGAQGGAQGGLPPNHPPVDESAQLEAMNKIITDLEAKIKAQPENDSLRLALANALYDANRHAEAKTHYSAYIAKHPENLDAATDFATSVAAAGNVDSAVTVLNSVLAKDSKHQRAAFNMAIMYRQKENRDSIIYWLERVAAIDSTTPTGRGAIDILKEFKSGHPPM